MSFSTATSATQERALRALHCSVLTTKALRQMTADSIPLADFVNTQGTRLGYTTTTVSELSAEDDLSWLIKVGVLRREVDGQGITDRFRLTPLGLHLQKSFTPIQVSPWEKTQDWLLRRLPY